MISMYIIDISLDISLYIFISIDIKIYRDISRDISMIYIDIIDIYIYIHIF